MKSSSEITVGIIAVLAILLLVVITFQLGNFDILSRQYRLYAEFVTTRGLESGAPVQVNGVPVGKVTRIKRVPGTRPVQVEFRVPKDVDIYSNAVIRISTAGMLGEKYLDIIPGSARSGKLVQSSYVFVGESSVELEQVLEQTPEIMNDLGATVVAIRRFVTDPKNTEAVHGTISNVQNITGRVDTMLSSSSQSITNMVSNMDQTTKNLNEMIAKLNVFVAEAQKDFDASRESVAKRYNDFSTKTDNILTNVESITKQLDSIAKRVDTTLADNQPEVKEISRNISRMTRELGDISEGINQGRGTLGKLAIDPRPFEDLRAILERLRALVEGGSANLRGEIKYEAPKESSKPMAPSRELSPAR